MGKSTISMAISNSYVTNYQRVMVFHGGEPMDMRGLSKKNGLIRTYPQLMAMFMRTCSLDHKGVRIEKTKNWIKKNPKESKNIIGIGIKKILSLLLLLLVVVVTVVTVIIEVVLAVAVADILYVESVEICTVRI